MSTTALDLIKGALRHTAGPTSVNAGLAARECDNQFVNWVYWAVDDVGGFAMVTTIGAYNHPSDLYVGGLDIVLNPIYGLQYQTVPAPYFL